MRTFTYTKCMYIEGNLTLCSPIVIIPNMHAICVQHPLLIVWGRGGEGVGVRVWNRVKSEGESFHIAYTSGRWAPRNRAALTCMTDSVPAETVMRSGVPCLLLTVTYSYTLHTTREEVFLGLRGGGGGSRWSLVCCARICC
jgi:hypothetical protein